MKTKAPVSIKKQSVTVKDLKTRKNPKGGAAINIYRSNIKHPSNDCNSGLQGVSTSR